VIYVTAVMVSVMVSAMVSRATYCRDYLLFLEQILSAYTSAELRKESRGSDVPPPTSVSFGPASRKDRDLDQGWKGGREKSMLRDDGIGRSFLSLSGDPFALQGVNRVDDLDLARLPVASRQLRFAILSTRSPREQTDFIRRIVHLGDVMPICLFAAYMYAA